MKILLRKLLFEKWWAPIVLYILVLIIYVDTLLYTNQGVNQFVDILLVASGIFLLIATIWQLVKGKAFKFLIQVGILILGFLGITIITIFMSIFGPDTDTFADNLELPKNVKLEYPLYLKIGDQFERIRPDSILDQPKENLSFQIYNSFQPGLYEYDIWYESDASGTIFLKAFEITQEIELSVPRLKERSSIRVSSTNGKIEKFGTTDHFSIYEGDWGQPYGARFEVWFNPDIGNRSIKLTEKNYIIEGWMR